MRFIKLEHSRAAYWADFALYGLTSLGLATTLWMAHPAQAGWALTGWAVGGLASWTLVEYLLHRYVLHGVAPFCHWHAEHHRRPTALMGSPTWVSATLFTTLVALPAWWLLGGWPASALTFGLITGYLAYGLTHHATHHPLPLVGKRNPWVMQRRRWHALHHAGGRGRAGLAGRARGDGSSPGHYGVISGLWDHAFGTQNPPTPAPPPQRRRP